ncbi:tetratricopeptide repeat protein [Stigmatella erecta]|uniref:Tetratricopeptide repeat-containing protein n=1 Tax=Stigmatella erecta TaxID=83460 RepID=A0A1I0A3Y3_9BACT|nr:tetratricopeptide repeat protein [Stigmatella erecta]SES88829.1 Tetratricopeptide repeat-containing protein [Stigmatella erecta]
MYNILISLGVGIAIALGVKLAGFPLWAGLVPGILAFVATFILLARRVAQRIQALMETVQKEFQGQPTSQKEALGRVERAVKTLEQGLVYEKWQIMVGPELHAQIGMLKYMAKDQEGARSHLARGSARNYMAKAMEGALHYQRKDYPAMEAAFEAAVKAGKKESLMWAAYAWCLVQLKEKDKALRVLARGVETNPSDEKLKSSLAQLQNDKRLKMKPYEPTWWQFGLETPPLQPMGGGGGRRVQFTTRR